MSLKSWIGPSGCRAALPGAGVPPLFSFPSPRKTDKRILAIVGSLVFLCWLSSALGPVSPARAEETLKPPEYDGQLIAEYSHKGHTQKLALEQEGVVKMPFRGETLDFYYGVKRDRKEERKPGALIVKVIYLYDSGTADIVDWAKYTELYRNPFPNRQAILDSAIRRPYYENYHKEDKDNIFLLHNFHTIFRDSQKTDGNYQRKRKFLFSTEPEWNPEVRRQRAYLLYYSGVDDSGTWVPFDVGITGKMSNILVSVIDLGQPSADLVERWWRISKEK